MTRRKNEIITYQEKSSFSFQFLFIFIFTFSHFLSAVDSLESEHPPGARENGTSGACSVSGKEFGGMTARPSPQNTGHVKK
jgi:hypothetical protein